MKTACLILSVLLVSMIVSYADDGWREKEMEVKVFLNSRQEAQRLHNLNLIGDIYMRNDGVDGFAAMYVIPGELQKIDELNLSYEIVVENLNEHYRDFWQQKAYRSYNEIIADMEKLERNYPELCKKYNYGTSVRNRELTALKISDNVTEEENEAEILFDGGIHGNEVGGPENTLLFAEDLCEKYGSDQRITDLLNSREVWIYCMVNPDGRVNNTRYNAHNIDLNRNWAYMTTMTSKGFSEPELRGIRDCLLENQFVIQITYHSGIECVLYPWGLINAPSPDKNHHEPLARLYYSSSDYSRLDVMSSYASYHTTGETLDYSYGALGISALTMEISYSKSPSDITGYYNKNYNAMLTMIKQAGYGLQGIVKDAQSGDPVAAVVYVNNSYPIYSDPEVGDYHKNVKAGTYSIAAFANGYLSKTIDNITVQNNSTTTTDIELEPDNTSSSSWGYKVVFVEPGQTSGAVNTPDVLGKNDSKSFTLKRGSEMVIDMQNAIKDIAGNDIKVHTTSSSGSYTCNAGEDIDGPWKSMGSGSGTKEFDLSEAGLDSARYIQIDGNCAIDAIEALEGMTDLKRSNKKPLPPVNLTVISNKKGISFMVKSDLSYTLKIFDVQGKLCWEPQASHSPGIYTWQPAGPGLYVAHLVSGNSKTTRKVLVDR